MVSRIRDAWLGIVAAGFVLLCTPCVPASAAVQGSDMKVAFLYNFAKFVEWPEKALHNETHTFTICIIGEDPMVQVADRILHGKQIQGRAVITRTLRSLEDAGMCHILFVDVADADLAQRSWTIARTMPILTVGESEQFILSGGIIKFFIEDNKLRFEISPQAAARVHLKISSKLLRLGRIVEGP